MDRQRIKSPLQLIPPAGLDNTFLLQRTALDLLFALPPDGLEPLSEMGVREVVGRVKWVRVEGAEVLGVQLEKAAGEILSVAEVLGKLVGLEFILAGNHIHAELDDQVEGSECVVEEEEADDDGALGCELERGKEGAVVDEDREEGKDIEEVSLRV